MRIAAERGASVGTVRSTCSVPVQGQRVLPVRFIRANNAIRAKPFIRANNFTRVHASSQQATWKEGFVLDNPLTSSPATVFDVAGKQLSLSELTAGRTVIGLLRHLGCVMCWAQANNLLQLKPELEALGFKLLVVAIGYPEGGKQLCASLPFPEDLLLLDPDRKVYTELHLNAGLNYFFNMDTVNGFRALDNKESKDMLKRYSFIRPPNAECTLQMGGLYVVDGPKLLYAHMDKGLGAHAPNAEVLAACSSGNSSA